MDENTVIADEGHEPETVTPAVEAETPAPVEAKEEKEEVKEEVKEPEEKLAPKTNKRIRDLLAERNRYKEMAEEAQRELEKIKAPTLEEFDHDIEKYTDARIGQVQQQSEAKAAINTYQNVSKQADQAILETWSEIKGNAVKKYADFAEVFTPSTPVSKEMAEALINSDAPEDVAYYLGKNQEEAKRIFSLPPHLQGYEIAKIETKAKPKATITQAPPPPNGRVQGVGQGKKSYDEMSDEEFAATRARERAEWRAKHY